MSNKMPNKAGTDLPSFNNFTKDRESDRIIRDLMFNEAAYITAERMARASVINADETKLRDSLMGAMSRHGLHPEKIPPMPQFLVRASQAPSTWQIDVVGEGVGRGGFIRERMRGGCITDDAGWSWACCHSLASVIDFSIIFIAEKALFSKHILFLAFQRFHRIHGHSGTTTPTGGKTV